MIPFGKTNPQFNTSMKPNYILNSSKIAFLSLALAATVVVQANDVMMKRAIDCAKEYTAKESAKGNAPSLRLILVNDNGTDRRFAVEIARYHIEKDLTHFKKSVSSGKSEITLNGTAERKGAQGLVLNGRLKVELDFIGARKLVDSDAGAAPAVSFESLFDNTTLQQGIPILDSGSGAEVTAGPYPYKEYNSLLLVWL